MKKIFVLILIFVSVQCFGQYPLIQNLASDSTLVRIGATYNGAIKGGIINMTFGDTTAANLSRISQYAGSQIFTTSDTSFWVRNKTVSTLYWFKVGSAGGGALGQFWPLGYRQFPTISSAFPPKIGTGAVGGADFTIGTNGIDRLKFLNSGIAFSNNATDSALGRNAAGELIFMPSGGGGGTPSPTGYALRFFHAEHRGNVWAQGVYPVGVDFKNCIYEFVAMPYDSAEYMISTGYGGIHIILFGFTGGTTGKMLLTGNMWYNGANVVALQGQDTVTTGTLHMFSVVYDGTWVTTFIDGVPSKRVAYTGYRNISNIPADADLFIGGSDHSKFAGLIWMTRGFEFFNDATPIGTTTCYFPKSIWQSGSSPYYQWDATSPSRTLHNTGVGLLGKEVSGALNVGAAFDEWSAGGFENADTVSLPHFVPAVLEQTAYSGTPGSIPVGIKVYDDFHRQDQVPFWTNNPSLGSTQGGSAGVQSWTLNTANPGGGSNFMGIIRNWAYSNSPSQFSYVDAGSANDSIIVTRASGLSESGIIVYARRSASDTYLQLQVDPSSGFTYLWKYVAGVQTYLGDFATNTSYSTLTLVVNGTTARVYENSTLKLTGIDITGMTGNNVGFGSGSAFVRVSKFQVY